MFFLYFCLKLSVTGPTPSWGHDHLNFLQSNFFSSGNTQVNLFKNAKLPEDWNFLDPIEGAYNTPVFLSPHFENRDVTLYFISQLAKILVKKLKHFYSDFPSHTYFKIIISNESSFIRSNFLFRNKF